MAEMKDAPKGADVQTRGTTGNPRRRYIGAGAPLSLLAPPIAAPPRRMVGTPTTKGWAAAIADDVKREVDKRLRALGWV